MTDHDTDQVSGPPPAIILVAPQMGENIGMVARAMANFGLSDLRIVNPRDGWPNDKAVAAASRATSVVDAARVYESLSEALADLRLVFATTARERDGFKQVRGPVEAAQMLRAHVGAGGRAGIMFGREKFGLDNEEISLADEIITFPVDPQYASLNVSQAVLLMAYEWRKAGTGGEGGVRFRGPEMLSAPKEELQGLFTHLETALDERGYFRPQQKKPKMVDKLRAVLTRPAFSSGELKVLRGIVASLDYFSPKVPRGAGYPQRKADVDKAAHAGRSAEKGGEGDG